MAFAKILSSQMMRDTTVAAPTVVRTEGAYLASLLQSGKGIQLDTWVAKEPAIAAACAKFYAAILSMNAGTQTLDLAGLAAPVQAGDLIIAACYAVEFFNNETIASGHNIIVGNDGSANEFFEPFGVAGSVVWIPPQTRRIFTTKNAGGWDTTSHSKLKLAPGGSYRAEAFVSLGGN